jgi:hypothetical protein
VFSPLGGVLLAVHGDRREQQTPGLAGHLIGNPARAVPGAAFEHIGADHAAERFTGHAAEIWNAGIVTDDPIGTPVFSDVGEFRPVR